MSNPIDAIIAGVTGECWVAKRVGSGWLGTSNFETSLRV